MNKAISPAIKTWRRYDRIAPYYDYMETFVETWRCAKWRTRLKTSVKGPFALEVGVGTEKNMAYYSSGIIITAIDFMLPPAKEDAKTTAVKVAH